MGIDRTAARRALSLIEGLLQEDADADGLLVDAFDGVEDAAQAHAYLAGFLLELLSDARHEHEIATAEYVRGLLADG